MPVDEPVRRAPAPHPDPEHLPAAVIGGWVAASLDAYGTPLRLDAEPRFATPAEAQARADARAFELARSGVEAVRRPDGSWGLSGGFADLDAQRIVVFETTTPQTREPVAPRGRRDPQPSGCTLTRPGHRMHWIQARKALEQPQQVRCEVVELIAPDLIVVAVDGEHLRRHHHRLDDVRAAIGRSRGRAALDVRWGLLQIDRRSFCVAKPEHWVPGCS